MNTLRVVLDTNVIVSSLLSSEGNPAKIYRMFLSAMLTLIFSEDILAEYREVIHRPHLRIPKDDADIVLAAIEQFGEKVGPEQSATVMIDEDDRIFYDAAKSTGAYLITGNIKHYPSEPFILTPAAFLEL
jgi:putative PIN family toxin of toxin-antitoxin system